MKLWYYIAFIFSYCVVGEDIDKIRKAGENAFAKGDMKKAAALFTKLIDADPKNERSLYKRFRVYLSDRKYSHALNDLTKALEINPSYKQALYQRGKIYSMLGRCAEGTADFEEYIKIDPKHKSIHGDLQKTRQCEELLLEAEKAQARGNYQAAHDALSNIIETIAGSSQQLLLERAEISVSMGNNFDAIADSGRVLKLDANNMAALQFRGQLFFQLGDENSLDAAVQHYRQALHSDPEHKAIKKEYRKVKKLIKLIKSVKSNMEGGRFIDAIEDLELALTIEPTIDAVNKDLWFKLCDCHVRLQKGKDAQASCTKAIKIDDENAMAHAKMGEALLLLEQYEEAVREYNRAAELDGENREIHQGQQKANVALKQSKEKNYYKILGVSRTAVKKVIKKAYRQLALQYHPDKHTDSDEAVQEDARKKFQDIAEAYEILSSEELRAKYDRGEDVSQNAQNQPQRQQHPFGHFFHGGGGGFGGGGRRNFHFKFG